MRALITGATGFAGSHLTDHCLAEGWEVHGTCLGADLRAPAIPGLTRHSVDLRDTDAVRAVVARTQPDRVFHLAAQASVAAAWADPAKTLTDNLVMTLRVLDAVRLETPGARVLVVGSSEEYGSVEPECFPVVESQELRPVDPYGVSKVACDLLAQQHFLAFGTHVVRVRPFNQLGPRQRRGFVLPDFAAGIVAIERGAAPVLKVGNLNSARDFTVVRDVVRAYRLMLELGEPGAVYNVCSGTTVRIGALLDILIGASSVPIRIELDPARTRPIDRPATVGSYAALHAATGWTPEIP
ncbi:MAG: rmd, partial [Chloroflexi bacterium]|nr:rmd [Chloroflexota bacterium]